MAEALAGVRSAALGGARPLPGAAAPLVLLSPGLGEYRAGLTGLAEELASRGLWVAGVDHPYDAAGVAFPDGRVVAHREPESRHEGDTHDLQARYLATRTDDLRFVLDHLLAADGPWRERVDPGRVAVAGHSLGGAAALDLALRDDRVAAAAVVDGSLYGPVLTRGLAVPVLLCALTPDDPDDPEILAGWDRVWPLLRGPRDRVRVPGAGHMSATDFDVLADPLGLRDPDDPDTPFSFGTLPPGDGLAAVRSVLGAFLAEHLVGVPTDGRR
ncbi:alpha/beta hydrolase family protein [Streptomyces buecherae]|uniref:alpha/beta hydrolase family protein n=1 Tax=Streptomyces buecherae TaxID=2763006 RepID=UPI00378D469A